MTRATPILAAGSEFDEFLYASMGVESNGMLLSVLSALARLNLDPWDEASRLARLPREAATRFLANLIATQPEGSSARTDPEMHAKRLSALLPHSVTSNSHSADPISTAPVDNRSQLVRYMVYSILLTIAFFGAQWFMQRSQEGARSDPPAAPATAPAVE